MAVLSLIMGILGVASAILPLFVDVATLIPGANNPTVRLIVNNAAFGFAIVGLVFALIGTHGIQAGKKKGKGTAVAGVLLCVLSVVAVLLTQYLLVDTVNSLLGKNTAVSGTPTASIQQSVAEAETFGYDTAVNPELNIDWALK